MIAQTKPIKSYKLEAARPGQTDVTPLRQVVEAAVDKTKQDARVRVLYLKSTASNAHQSPQPFLTTKFDSRREDSNDRSTAPRWVAQRQHLRAREHVSSLVKPLQNLPGTHRSVQQAALDISDLCDNDNAQLFGLPCTDELLQQLKQIEDEQAQRAAQQRPQAQTHHTTNCSPKAHQIPPLKLGTQENSTPTPFARQANPPSGAQTDRPRRTHPDGHAPSPSAAASTPTTPLPSDTSTEDSSERSSPGNRKLRTVRRQLVQQGTRHNVKDSSTARRLPTQQEQWEQNIASPQDGFFPKDKPTKQASRSDQPPAPVRSESTDTPGQAPTTPTLASPLQVRKVQQMLVRPSLKYQPRPQSDLAQPTPVPRGDDDKRDAPQPQAPQTDKQ